MFGMILVIIGVVLAGISLFAPESRYRGVILPIAVILIGVGVLCGADALVDVSNETRNNR